MANMLFMAEEYHSLLYQEAITILKFRDGLSWVDARGVDTFGKYRRWKMVGSKTVFDQKTQKYVLPINFKKSIGTTCSARGGLIYLYDFSKSTQLLTYRSFQKVPTIPIMIKKMG